MSIYNEKYLHECIKLAGATLIIVDLSNIKRDIPVTFNCKCGKEHTKTFRRITTSGSYCELCIQENGVVKGKKTREMKMTEEEKNTIVNNAISTQTKSDQETIWKKERDEIIKNPPKANIWYTHPTAITHQANTNGEVRNKSTEKIVEGSETLLGRQTVTIKKRKYQKHRFIMEALYDTIIPMHFDIDHINPDPSNNHFSNLQILTKKEHASKTASDNHKNIKEREKKYAIKVGRIKDDKTETFLSLTDASKKCNIDTSTIKLCIESGNVDTNGYIWIQYENDKEDIPDEIWKEHIEYKGLLLSNKGRVHNTHIRNSYPDRGSLSEYYIISFKGKHLKVHKLICETFIGLSPGSDYTVDHIDNDKINNNAENLRWASKKEQSCNRTSVKGVEVYDIDTFIVIKKFSTAREVSEEYKISEATISDILNLSRHDNKIKYKLKDNLSIRYSDISIEDKKEREFKILEYDIEILNRDKHKRLRNIDLPLHIIKSGNQYYCTITFRKEKYKSKRNNDIDVIIQLKHKWITEKVQYYKDRINILLI